MEPIKPRRVDERGKPFFGQELMIPEEAIRLRSYQIWEREGRPDGKALEHWLVACMELEVESRGQYVDISEWRNTVMPRLPATRRPQKIVSRRVGAIAARG